MIEFEVLEVGRGWIYHSVPDELAIELRLEATEHEFYISIVDLVRIYSVVRARDEERIVDFGSSGAFELERIRGDVGFIRMPPICIGLSMEGLEEALGDLLGEVFAMCDEVDGPKKREQEFPDMQRMLDERDCDVDIRSLYERLSESSDG